MPTLAAAPAAAVTIGCPLWPVPHALRVRVSQKTVRRVAAPLPVHTMIALVVPLAILLVAIRRNSGVFAAFLLLMLFAARM